MTATKQERYAEAFRKRGLVEIECASRKYRAFRHPDREVIYFLGKSGAVRFGKNVSSSIGMPDLLKAKLLEAE